MSVTYSMQLTNIDEGTLLSTLFVYLEKIFSHLIKRIIRNYSNPDKTKMVLILDDEGSQLDCPLVVPLRFLNEYSAQLILAQLAAIIQSKQSLSFQQNLSLTVGTVSYLSIGHNNKLTYVSSNNMESLKQKKFIKVFDGQEGDKCCFLRALTYGLLLNQNKPVIVNKKTQSAFDKKAKKVGEKCGISWGSDVQLDMLPVIESKLSAMIILIKFKDLGNGFEVMYTGNENFASNTVYILIIPPYHPDKLHAVGITNSSKLFWSNSLKEIMCKHCKAIVKTNHVCEKYKYGIKCYSCMRINCPEKITNNNTCTITCRLCTYSFMGDQCYDQHKKPGKKGGLSLCDRRYRCLTCFTNSSDGTPRNLHVHGMKKCTICKCNVIDVLENRHHCHITVPTKIDPVVSRLIAYDIECSILEEGRCESPNMQDGICTYCRNKTCTLYVHKPLAIVSFSCCENCKLKWANPMEPDAECETCGWRCSKCKSLKNGPYCNPRNCDSHGNRCRSPYVKFVGIDCIRLFVDYITDKRRKDFTLFAHGNSHYDS